MNDTRVVGNRLFVVREFQDGQLVYALYGYTDKSAPRRVSSKVFTEEKDMLKHLKELMDIYSSIVSSLGQSMIELSNRGPLDFT